MRLTSQQIQQEGINVKAWLGEIQRASKGSDARSFALKGPMTTQVRKRRSGSGPSFGSASHAFFGGEEFRVGGIVHEPILIEDSIEIRVTLVPSKMALASEMSGMTLTLQECMEHLEGFEEWIENFGMVKHQEPAKRPVPIAQQREENPMWGAW